MKIAMLNDSHFGVRNDKEVFLKLQQDFFEKLFFPYLEEHKISNILHLGDLFDRRKYINFKTFQKAEEMFFDVAYEKNITIDSFVGNHDTYYKDTNRVNSLNLIAAKFDNINVYDNKPVVKKYDGVEIGLVPWICRENYEDCIKFLKETDVKYIAGHFEIVGFEFMAGIKNHEGLSTALFNRFEQVWSGHFHHRSSKGNISYLGTQYELSWSDYGHKKGFHVFDTETKELTFVPNPHTIYSKIYYNDEKNDYMEFDYDDFKGRYIKVMVVNKKNHLMFDRFITKLQEVNPVDISIVEDHQNLEDDLDINMEKTEDTMTILDNYVDQMELSCNKDQIKNIIRELHTEAISME